MGIGSHTDYECLTLLYSTVPGLEVLNSAGSWIDAPPLPGALVINIGDMMEIWTNGEFVATSHRVRPVKEERFSFPLRRRLRHRGQAAGPVRDRGAAGARGTYRGRAPVRPNRPQLQLTEGAARQGRDHAAGNLCAALLFRAGGEIRQLRPRVRWTCDPQNWPGEKVDREPHALPPVKDGAIDSSARIISSRRRSQLDPARRATAALAM